MQASVAEPPTSLRDNVRFVTLAKGADAKMVRFELTVPLLFNVGALKEQVRSEGIAAGQLKTIFAVFNVVPLVDVTTTGITLLVEVPAGSVIAL